MKEIPLTQGQVALVDNEDYDFLAQWKWSASKTSNTWYAMRISNKKDGCRYGKRYSILMHRVIMKAKLFDEVDHIDHNGLNNQHSNLRIATRSQNKINAHKTNSTGYRGVELNKYSKKFSAHIRINGKLKHLGVFEMAKDAAIAYNKAAIKYHKEFAILNIFE